LRPPTQRRIHIKNIFDEKELTEEATVKDYFTVQKERNREVSRKVPGVKRRRIIGY
jgi:hypothetical protein